MANCDTGKNRRAKRARHDGCCVPSLVLEVCESLTIGGVCLGFVKVKRLGGPEMLQICPRFERER